MLECSSLLRSLLFISLYLAIQTFTQFCPDSYEMIITPSHYEMRGAWVILRCVHKTRVRIQFDGRRHHHLCVPASVDQLSKRKCLKLHFCTVCLDIYMSPKNRIHIFYFCHSFLQFCFALFVCLYFGLVALADKSTSSDGSSYSS